MKRFWCVALLCSASLVLFGCPTGDDDDDDGGPVTITVHDDSGNPLMGARLSITDALGALVELITTDAAGQVSVAVPHGGAVTYAQFDTGFGITDTVGGLRGGNDLRFGVFDQTTATTVSVTVPGMFAGAAEYEVDIGCDFNSTADAGTPTDVFVFGACALTSLDIQARALDASGLPLAHVTMTGVDASSGSVTMSGAWDTTFDNFDINVSGIAAGDGAFVFANLRRGDLFFFAGSEGLQADGTTSVMVVPGFGDGLSYGVANFAADGSLAQIQRGVPGNPGSDSFDLAAELPPAVTDFTVDLGPDPLRPTFNYTATGDLTTYDVAFTDYDFDRPGGDFVIWQMIDDPQASGYQSPALPDELASNRPAAGDMAGGAGIFLIDTDFTENAHDYVNWTEDPNSSIPQTFEVKITGF